MPDLPVDPDQSDQSKRRTLLRYGHDREWWDYQSENRPGYVDGAGTVYGVVTYTLVLPPVGDRPPRERVLLADEVIGYVLRAAEDRGEVDRIAYRPGLTPLDAA